MLRWSQGGRRAITGDKALLSVLLVSGPLGPGRGSDRLCSWRSLWERRVAGRQAGRQAGRGCGVSRGQPGKVSQRRRRRSTGQGVAACEPPGEGGGGTLVPAAGGWGPLHPEKAPSHPPWAPLAFRAHDHPHGQTQKDLSRVGSRCWLGWWGALLGHPQITLCPSGRIPGRSGLRVDWLGWPPRHPEAPHPPEAASLPGWMSCRSAQALVAEWAEGSWLRNRPQGSSVQPPLAGRVGERPPALLLQGQIWGLIT